MQRLNIQPQNRKEIDDKSRNMGTNGLSIDVDNICITLGFSVVFIHR